MVKGMKPRSVLVDAVTTDASLARGVNVYEGHITHAGLAGSLGLPYTPLDKLLPR